jgi:hypothetical protein
MRVITALCIADRMCDTVNQIAAGHRLPWFCDYCVVSNSQPSCQLSHVFPLLRAVFCAALAVGTLSHMPPEVRLLCGTQHLS